MAGDGGVFGHYGGNRVAVVAKNLCALKEKRFISNQNALQGIGRHHAPLCTDFASVLLTGLRKTIMIRMLRLKPCIVIIG
jgi:hypothetical protein